MIVEPMLEKAASSRRPRGFCRDFATSRTTTISC